MNTKTTAFPRSPKRTIAIAAALLAAGLIAGIGPAQAKDTRPETRTVEVDAHYTEKFADGKAGATCLLGESEQECRVRFEGWATFTGTLWGDEYFALTGGDPAGFPEGKFTYEGTAYFNGGVKGCGTGTYILEGTEGYIDMSKYDPITDSAPGYNKWHLRPGSGTGELTNLVSGSGETHWRMHLGGVGITPHFGDGDFTGTITCRR